MFGKQNFIGKAIGLFMNCDKMLGSYFDKGLAQMKSVDSGYTMANVGITPMIGVNDDGSVFTTANATSVESFAAGNGYTLAATAPGLAGSTSAGFTVAPGTATQLAFTLQPSTTTTGATIKPAVRVTAFDALGNTATGFAGNVTIALAFNPAGGTLSGTRTFAAIAGVATFPSLNIDNVGSGYTLAATAPGLTGATSAGFDIIPSTATQLVFTVQPTDTAHRATAGVVFTPALGTRRKKPAGQTKRPRRNPSPHPKKSKPRHRPPLWWW